MKINDWINTSIIDENTTVDPGGPTQEVEVISMTMVCVSNGGQVAYKIINCNDPNLNGCVFVSKLTNSTSVYGQRIYETKIIRNYDETKHEVS